MKGQVGAGRWAGRHETQLSACPSLGDGETDSTKTETCRGPSFKHHPREMT